jgi:hypothetical protein
MAVVAHQSDSPRRETHYFQMPIAGVRRLAMHVWRLIVSHQTAKAKIQLEQRLPMLSDEELARLGYDRDRLTVGLRDRLGS